MEELTGGFVKDPEGIPERNARMMEKLGEKGCRERFEEMIK